MAVTRYLFCGFNLIFCVFGVFLQGCGIWLVLENHAGGTLVPDGTEETNGDPGLNRLVIKGINRKDEIPVHTMVPAVGWICVGIGAAMFFVSFIGYCGSLRESLCLLGTYTTLLGIVIVLEIIAVSLFFVHRPKVDSEAKEQLVKLVQTYYSALDKKQARILFHGTVSAGLSAHYNSADPSNSNELRMKNSYSEENMTDEENVITFTRLFDSTMRSFKCCGVVSYHEFSADQLPPRQFVPVACCKLLGDDGNTTALKDPDCVYQPHFGNSWIGTGCYDRVIGAIVNGAIVTGAVVGLLQLAGIVSAFFGAQLVYKGRL